MFSFVWQNTMPRSIAQKLQHNPAKVRSGTDLLGPGNLHPCRTGANSLLTNWKWTSEFYQGYRTEYSDTFGSCNGLSIKFYLSAYPLKCKRLCPKTKWFWEHMDFLWTDLQLVCRTVERVCYEIWGFDSSEYEVCSLQRCDALWSVKW